MASSFNRRQLGKGLIASVALAPLRAESRGEIPASADVVQTGWVTAGNGIWKARLGTPEAITPVSSRLVESNLDGLRSMDAVAAPPIEAPTGAVRDRSTLISLPLAARENLYGFGLQFFTLAQRGKKRVIRVNADPRMDTGDSHAPVPFFVSSRGYGILVDTARYATFYCGEARPKPTQPTGIDAGGTDPLYTKNLEEDESSQVLVEVPSAPGVDVYLFAGPSMIEAVRRYNLFSGGGPVPPEWGLGFWYRAESNAPDHQLLAFAEEFRKRNIPCDVLGLEPGWHSHAYSCTYTWNRERYPEPRRFITDLRRQNYHVNLWEHAFIHPASPLFPPMRELSGDKGVWGGLVPDFQSLQARETFGSYHGKELVDLGISGFKLDECDNSDYTGGWSFPELSQFPSGMDGERMHNLFGLRYQAALWKPFQDRNQPTYQLVRSSGALATPYPFVLYSDLYDHRQFVRALVNSSFSGLLWCPEVRDAKSEEDLIRRLQTVVFSPLAMVNGWYIANPPWKQLDRKKNNANELMPNWEALESRCREIIGWRMQLVPYLRAAFARYAADGTPPFRALALDFPEQPEVAATDDAWMVGDRMLVAPLFAGEPQRTLHLPAGNWQDFWTGEHMAGGKQLTLPAGTRNMPVFVKAGSVLPLATITNSTADPASRVLEVKVFGDGHLPFSMKIPEGDKLELTWNDASKSGSAEQGPGKAYTIAGWQPASGS